MKTSKSHIAQMCISIDHQITRAKDAFEYFINDKTMPIAVRWEVFKETPDYLKNKESWIYHFECLTRNQDDEWLDNCWNRGQTVNFVDVIDGMDADIAFLKQEAELQGTDLVFDSWYDPVIVNIMKEEIMRKNLGSFVYDW